MDTQDLVNLVKMDREARREAIETVSKIANYLDKVGREDLADELMEALDTLKL
jgi:uncharacterized membrane protein